MASDRARAAGERLAGGRREEAERRKEDLKGSGKRGERDRSRTAFKGLGRERAAALAREKFPELFEAAKSAKDRLEETGRIAAYLDDFTARVDRGGGRGSVLAVSSLPLRQTNAAGDKAPVDLALRASGADFSSVNPLVDARLPGRLSRQLEVGSSKLGVSLEGAADAPGALESDGRAVTYGAAFEDADVLVTPAELGVEIAVQIRSPAAPETYTWRLALPAGAQLRAEGEAAVVVRGDRELARISQPRAYDAQGQELNSSLRVAGDQVILSVAHRGRDVAYPATLDPLVTESYNEWTGRTWYDGGNLGALDTYGRTNDADYPYDWAYRDRPTGSMRWGTRCWTDGPGDDCYGSGRGLQIWMAPGFYGAYTYGEWVYTIPGYWETPQPTTYIAATTFSHMNINCRGDNNLYPYVIAGIYSPRAGNWTGYYAWPCGAQNFSYTQGPGNNVTNPDTLGGKTAAFALGTQYAGGRGTWADGYLGGAEIYLDDPEEPTLTGAPTHSINPAQWTDGTETRTVTASATDPGLGVKYFNLDRQDPAGWTFTGQAYHPCNGTRAARCPRNWTASVNYDTSQLPEGITNYRIVPYDPDFSDTPNPSTPWTVKIDRSEPAIDLTGSLSDNSERALVDGSYDIAVTVSDGIETDPESGVDRIEVLLDDDPYGQAAQQTQPADNATLSHSVSLQTETLDEGLHTVVVRATDRAGNVAEKELEFVVDHVVELPAQSLSPESASLRIDGEGNGQRAGTAVNAVGDLNGDDIDDFAIGAPAADPAGRTGAGTVHVVFGSDTAGSIDTASLGNGGFHILGAQALDYTGASVASAGDVNGDSYDDFLIGAPRVGDLGVPVGALRGSAYVIYGGGLANDIDLANLGSRGFRVDGPLLDLPAISLQYDRRPTAFGEALGAAPATLAGGNHGDVNGDGLDDIIIGASAQNPQGRIQAGSAYVVLGSETNPGAVDASNIGTQGFRVDGPSVGALAGYSVAIIGDANNDGLDDIALGAPGVSPLDRSSAGATFVVFGQTSASTIDLAALGERGYQIIGRATSSIGFSVAGIGDLDWDGQDDLALGGSDSFVTYGRATTTPLDLADPSGSYSLGRPATVNADQRVAGAGDLNMDDTPDVLVGIDNPVMLLGDSGDSGDSYIVFGRRSRSGEQATGDLNIAGLRGDQGTRIIGNLTNDRFGTALSPVLAADATGEPGVLVGAPAADPRGRTDAGSAYVIPARTLGANQEPEATAAASSGDRPAPNSAFKRGFYGGIKKPYPLVFRYDPDYDPNPYNREFDDSFYDLPQTRRTRRNRLQDGKFPTVGEGNGNATRLVKNLTRGTPENPTLHPVMDSYGNAFAYLEQIRRGRFKVYNQNRQLLDETRTDVPSRLGGKRRGQARIELQGRACVAPGVQNAQRLVVVALVSGPATSQTQADPALRANVGKNGNYIGLRGFIDEQAIRDKLEEGSSNAAFINRFRVPCVRPRKKFKPLTAQPEIFGPQGFVRGEDQYVSKAAHYACRDYADTQISNPTARNVRGDPERVDCGQAYATYEAPAGLTPSGQEVALLTRSTTGHTGRGGAVTAIVRLNREWQVIDEVGYQDPNVACSRKRVAKWVFVNANPNGSPIYGWFALRQPLAGDTGYRWNVRLASGSPRTRACAARGVPEPEGGGRGEGPPDTTS